MQAVMYIYICISVCVRAQLCSLRDPALFVGRLEMREREWAALRNPNPNHLRIRRYTEATVDNALSLEMQLGGEHWWVLTCITLPFHKFFVNCNVISHRFQMDQRVCQLCGGKLWLLALTILNVPWKMRLPAVRRQGWWKTPCQVKHGAVGIARGHKSFALRQHEATSLSDIFKVRWLSSQQAHTKLGPGGQHIPLWVAFAPWQIN